jgi:hypothetical protein
VANFFGKGIFYIFGADILPKALLCKQIGMYELMLILQQYISYLSDKITKKSSNKENCFPGQKFISGN